MPCSRYAAKRPTIMYILQAVAYISPSHVDSSSSLWCRLRPRILKDGSLFSNDTFLEIQLPHHLERSRPLTDALPHDDALADSFDLVPLHMPRGLKQVIGRLLETGKLEHAVPHLAHPETRYAQDFAFERHHVGEQLHVPRVNVQGTHHEADFVDDGLSRRFDAEDLAHFHDRVRSGGESIHSFCRHAIPETITFYHQCVLASLVLLDDSTGSFGVSANGDVWEDSFDRLYTEKELRVLFRGSFGSNALGTTFIPFYRLNINADVFSETSDMVWAQFELLLPYDCVGDISGVDVQL